jgi:hypothetical protein
MVRLRKVEPLRNGTANLCLKLVKTFFDVGDFSTHGSIQRPDCLMDATSTAHFKLSQSALHLVDFGFKLLHLYVVHIRYSYLFRPDEQYTPSHFGQRQNSQKILGKTELLLQIAAQRVEESMG